MAQTPESKVKAKVKLILKKHSAYYAMPMGTGFGNAGVPDFLVCVAGSFIGIECKAKGGKLTALQNANLGEIEAAGGKTFVVTEHNLDELDARLSTISWKGEVND